MAHMPFDKCLDKFLNIISLPWGLYSLMLKLMAKSHHDIFKCEIKGVTLLACCKLVTVLILEHLLKCPVDKAMFSSLL